MLKLWQWQAALHLHHARTAARENEGVDTFGGALVRSPREFLAFRGCQRKTA